MINRLLGMIYILMRQGTVTAAELAERFEVSVRTIYRDMDTLSAAGIPIYAKKGKNGGICLTEQFVLNKNAAHKGRAAGDFIRAGVASGNQGGGWGKHLAKARRIFSDRSR